MIVQALIADSSPRTRNAIRQQLECMGCEVVVEVETAGQAMMLMRTVRPDIVALGIDLSYAGEATPIELVREIKREAPRTAVVMLDGTSKVANNALFLNEGALDCVEAPFGCASFNRLWARLSTAFPQLRTSRFGAMMATPKSPPRHDGPSRAESKIETPAESETQWTGAPPADMQGEGRGGRPRRGYQRTTCS
jgi:DNA-binding NtrC family response regulator